MSKDQTRTKKANLAGKAAKRKSEASTSIKEKAESIGRKTFTWKLTAEEIEKRTFHLRYNTRSDCYYRLSSSNGKEYRPAIEGWQNGVFGSMNIQRCHATKTHDQEWAYLTRKTRCSYASVSWWLDFRESGMVIDDVSVFTYGRTLRKGRLTYDLLSPDSVPSDSIRKRKSRNKKALLNGWQSLLIVAHLEGGVGRRQEEETQLFFQDCSNQPDFCPLDITITLKPMELVNCTCHLSRKLPPLRRAATERGRAVSCSTISGNASKRCQSFQHPPHIRVTKNFGASNVSWVQNELQVVSEQRPKQQWTEHKTSSLAEPDVKATHRKKKDFLGMSVEGYINQAHIIEDEETSVSRTPSATPIVAELQPIHRRGDHLQMITQVGSIKREKKKPPRLKKDGDKKTHPTSENFETTEVPMHNTIATIAISDASAGPSHSDAHPEYASDKRQEQQGNTNEEEIVVIPDTRDRGSRCILM